MDTLPFLLLGLFGIAVIAFVLRHGHGATVPRLPFTRRDALLSPAELRFYRVLMGAAPPGLAVFAKVRLMDVVQVPGDAWRQYGAPGSGMHLDFLIVDAATTAPRLVIELDDKSHWQAEARTRDAFKDAALASAGVPILRVTAAGRYHVGELRTRVMRTLA